MSLDQGRVVGIEPRLHPQDGHDVLGEFVPFGPEPTGPVLFKEEEAGGVGRFPARVVGGIEGAAEVVGSDDVQTAAEDDGWSSLRESSITWIPG